MSAPVPIDVAPFSGMIEGSAEFLRVWMRPDGAAASFINPVPVGADPALFGAAIADVVASAAETYAAAVGIGAAAAAARIWQGLDAARAATLSTEND